VSYLEDQDTLRCADCEALINDGHILCEECENRDSRMG
jgi:RNA polymerase subunit RPABC4/transcription elongation factor Spt4